MLYVPPVAALFHAVPLSFDTLAALVLAASTSLWVQEAHKALLRRRRSIHEARSA